MVRGQNPRYSWSLKDVGILMVALVIVVGGVIVVFDVDVGSMEWERPTSSASYVVIISSNSTSLDFVNGEIGWWALDVSQSPNATVEIKIAVLVNVTDVSFQLAEYYPEGEEWMARNMQEDVGEKTWVSSVEINKGDTRQFAIWLFDPDGERRGTSCRFYLQSIGGKIVVGPV